MMNFGLKFICPWLRHLILCTEFTAKSRKARCRISSPFPPPRSSNRTCGFPASGSPTGFTASMRRASDLPRHCDSASPSSRHSLPERLRNYAALHRLAPSHPLSPSSTSTPEVRVLSSTGITRLLGPTTLSDYRVGRRLTAPLRPLPSSSTGLPRLRSPVSTCRAQYPGGPIQVHMSAASADRAAFPELRAGRRPRPPFRALLRLARRIRSAAHGDVCR